MLVGIGEFTTHFRFPILVVGLNRMFTGGTVWVLTHGLSGTLFRFPLFLVAPLKMVQASKRVPLFLPRVTEPLSKSLKYLDLASGHPYFPQELGNGFPSAKNGFPSTTDN